jgi:hypothetical protein
MIDTRNVMAITGKPGLYRIISQMAKSIVVESMDEQRTKMPVHTNYQVALLEEITIYTKDDSRLTLKDIIRTLEAEYADALPISIKDIPAKLKEFMQKIAPLHDSTRVYVSDIQKIIKWYGILKAYAPQIDKEPEENQSADVQPASTEETTQN